MTKRISRAHLQKEVLASEMRERAQFPAPIVQSSGLAAAKSSVKKTSASGFAGSAAGVVGLIAANSRSFCFTVATFCCAAVSTVFATNNGTVVCVFAIILLYLMQARWW